MLEIRPYMDSAAAEIFSFKCSRGVCNHDQNLEIHVHNQGDRPIVVPSHFDLEGDDGTHRVRELTPQGDQIIEPDGSLAFFCFLDEVRWSRSRRMVFHDAEGNRYPVDLRPYQAER